MGNLHWSGINIQETGRQAVSALLSPADCSEHGTFTLALWECLTPVSILGHSQCWGLLVGGGMVWFHDPVVVEQIHSTIHSFSKCLSRASSVPVCWHCVRCENPGPLHHGTHTLVGEASACTRASCKEDNWVDLSLSLGCVI